MLSHADLLDARLGELSSPNSGLQLYCKMETLLISNYAVDVVNLLLILFNATTIDLNWLNSLGKVIIITTTLLYNLI